MARVKFKRKKPKTSHISFTPAIYLTNKTAKVMTDIRNNWPKRVEEGRKIFLVQLSDYVRNEIVKKAPEINGQNYARDLKIGFVSGVDDNDVVAIYFDDVSRKFKVDEKKNVVLMIGAHNKSPKYVYVLEDYGPWPSHILPIRLEEGDAKIVARNVRNDEMRSLESRIFSNKIEIENKLRAAGAKEVKIVVSKNAEGIEVHDDVGYTVLRKEFGFDGQQEPHWRPALKKIKTIVKKLLDNYLYYIMTGRVAEIPDVDDISKNVLKKGEWFQNKLTPFLPK